MTKSPGRPDRHLLKKTRRLFGASRPPTRRRSRAKDLALFKSIKPNLSREEERRLQDGFRAVSSQRVALTITSIDRRGDEASVRLKRRDTIEAGGRTQTVDSDQTLQLARTGAGWVVVAIR